MRPIVMLLLGDSYLKKYICNIILFSSQGCCLLYVVVKLGVLSVGCVGFGGLWRQSASKW
jgi:hypothetical protein